MSQRQHPQMALIRVVVSEGALRAYFPDGKAYGIPMVVPDQVREVSIWQDTCAALDQGDEISTALTKFMEKPCRLMYMPDFVFRQVNQKYAAQATDEVGFADGYPFLLISEASLEDLNSRLAVPVPMNRFRPNLVIKGCSDYEEDAWKIIRIGKIRFHIAKPCSRCILVNVDQSTAARGQEPLQTLATYRKREKGVMFGQNLVQMDRGVLSLGDSLEVLELL